jgi:hypothetical protein
MDPEPYKINTDPDPGGPKTSESGTLIETESLDFSLCIEVLNSTWHVIIICCRCLQRPNAIRVQVLCLQVIRQLGLGKAQKGMRSIFFLHMFRYH